MLLSVAESKGVQSELIPKIATGFCAGISRTCDLCGAVGGAVMAISLFSGRSKPDDSNETCFKMVQELFDMFEKKFGSTNCKELTGCDLGTEEGRTAFKKENKKNKCMIFTKEAAGMAMLIIVQDNQD